MDHDRYNFRGLDEVERELRIVDEGATHLLLQDRTEPGSDVTVGRFDLTEENARPWLTLIDQERRRGLPLRRTLGLDAPPPTDRPELDDGEDDPDDDIDVGASDGDDEPPTERIARQERGAVATRLSHRDILDIACWWVRSVAIRNTFAEAHRRFRVRVYGNKGTRSYYCGQFICQNLDHRQQLEPPPSVGAPPPPPVVAPMAAVPSYPPPAPARVYEDAAPPVQRPAVSAEQEGVAEGMRALGNYYSQFGHLALSAPHPGSLTGRRSRSRPQARSPSRPRTGPDSTRPSVASRSPAASRNR